MNCIQCLKTTQGKKIFLALVLLVFVASLVLYICFSPEKRVVMLFESMDSSDLYSEERYIPQKTSQGSLEYFIDELLLGPVSDRYKPLFANGTKTTSCFLTDDKTLYIDLNEKAVLEGNMSSETLIGCDLLKKNVLKNYNYVDKVEVFILGNLIK